MTRHLFSTALLAMAVTPSALADVPKPPTEPDAPEPPRAEIQRELNDTRDELRTLSERIAELSLKLVDEPISRLHEALAHSGERHNRAAIGATIQSVIGERGAKVLAVTPDGPADQAGLRTGDVIVGMGRVRFDDPDVEATEQLTEFMAEIDSGDTVEVAIERDGQPMNLSIEAEPLSGHDVFAFSFDGDMEGLPHDLMNMDLPGISIDGESQFQFFFADGPWSDMEVVALTPGLGDYFGVSEGLLVVRAPDDDSVDLRDGDVIVRVDGDALANRRSLERTLARRKAAQTVRFDIVRQRSSMSVEAVVPRRGKSHRHNDTEVFIHKSR